MGVADTIHIHRMGIPSLVVCPDGLRQGLSDEAFIFPNNP